MPYVVTYKGRVILGPYADWSVNYINAIIRQRTPIDNVTITHAMSEQLPLVYNNGDLIIRNCVEVIPNIDNRFERLDGPFWEFTENLGTATYVAAPKNLDLIKGEMKAIAARKRYEKEVAGFKMTINDQEVTIETGRDDRNVFVQALLLMPDDGQRIWKFPKENIWVSLNKAQIGSIVSTGAIYIQDQFNWEEDVCMRIDACDNTDDLAEIYTEIDPPREDPFHHLHHPDVSE